MSPYNLTPNAVTRLKDELECIVQNYGATIEFESINPLSVAYKLREAVLAAKTLEIEPYGRIEYQFTADVKNGKVICKPRTRNPLRASVLAPEENTYPEASTAFDVVELATMVKADMMSFPNYSEDIESVLAWAESRGYSVVSEKPLTLKKSG